MYIVPLISGYPDITGQLEAGELWDSPYYGNFAAGSGSFSLTTTGRAFDTEATGKTAGYRYANFNASRSSAVYGSSSTVQPVSYTAQYLIKY